MGCHYQVYLFRKQQRTHLYQLQLKRFSMVPCFVCHDHVDEQDATLEHITPLSKGGQDVIANYAISHRACNWQRGNHTNF